MGNVSETPTPTTCLKSTAVHLQFVRQYAPHLYRRTFLELSFEERETLQYASHLYCSTLTLESSLFSFSSLFSLCGFPCFFVRFCSLFQGFQGFCREENPRFFRGILAFFAKKGRIGGSGYASHLYGSTHPICTAVLLEKILGVGVTDNRNRRTAQAAQQSQFQCPVPSFGR